MNKGKGPFYILVLVLVCVGVALSWYRHYVFNVPWVPGEQQQVWSVEARIEFVGDGSPAIVSFSVPDSQSGFKRLSEYTASPGYGLAFIERVGARKAEWSVREASGKQILYYRAEFAAKNSLDVMQERPELGLNKLVLGSGPHLTVANSMLESAKRRSADEFTFIRELIGEFNAQTESVFLLEQYASREAWLVALLQQSGVTSRLISVLELEDGRRRTQLLKYIQVFSGNSYALFDPSNGEISLGSPVLMWEYHSQPVLDVMGGRQSQLSFSVIEQKMPLGDVAALQRERRSGLLNFSIHTLPLSEQALFKGILLIPIGVLAVCFLRILVGIRTAGTFMPVLIAISFIQTSLVTGLVGFVLIVGVGLLIRGYLSRLNLLLVARISTVIISVIILIAMLAVLSYQLGLSEGLKISFFPMIILSWTIERMSILWEEEGGSEVIIQVGGSLSVAVVTYGLMMNEFVQHLTFNFIGLQLVIMACVLMLGTYTGYRFLELHRFYAMIKR